MNINIPHKLLILFTLWSISTSAQNTVGITPLEFDQNSGLFMTEQQPLLTMVYGIFYDRELKNRKWTWANNIARHNKDVTYGCRNCPDVFYGTINSKGINLSSGLRYNIIQKYNSPWNLFLQSDIYFERNNLYGHLEGGLSGGGTLIDQNYFTLSLMIRTGVEFTIAKRLMLGYQIGVIPAGYYNYYSNNNSENKSSGINIGSFEFPNYGQFRLGYRF